MNKNKIRNIILKLYAEDKNVVNDDVILLERVWIECGWSNSRSLYDNLSRMPRSESITRRRRELYNEGLIQYSDNALEARTEAYKSERDYQSKAVSWLNG